MDTCTIQTVPPRERRHGLRRLLAAPNQSAVELEAQVSAFEEYARAMSLDLSRMWSVGAMGVSCGAIVLCIPSAGRTAMLMMPDARTVSPSRNDLMGLVQQALADESIGDVRLFQCLLSEPDDQNRDWLSSAGFREIATLVYMERDVSASGPARQSLETAERLQSVRGADSNLSWIQYDESVRELFARTIFSTYENSLDCPGLAGLRTMEDILASHRAAGQFSPHRWRLLMIDDRAAGCILLAEHPLQPVLEMAYMGVTGAFRGRGVGALLICEALKIAHHEQFQRVTLAVDSRNDPALHLYDRAGFKAFLRRRAMLFVRDSSSIASRDYE